LDGCSPLGERQSRERSERTPVTCFNGFSNTDQKNLERKEAWPPCYVIPLPAVTALKACIGRSKHPVFGPFSYPLVIFMCSGEASR
jgi:hypothetical protein